MRLLIVPSRVTTVAVPESRVPDVVVVRETVGVTAAWVDVVFVFVRPGLDATVGAVGAGVVVPRRVAARATSAALSACAPHVTIIARHALKSSLKPFIPLTIKGC